MYVYLKKDYVFIYSFIYALHMFLNSVVYDARYSVVRIFLNIMWAYKLLLHRIDSNARCHIREAASVIYIFKVLFYFREKKVVGLKSAWTVHPYTFLALLYSCPLGALLVCWKSPNCLDWNYFRKSLCGRIFLTQLFVGFFFSPSLSFFKSGGKKYRQGSR